MSDPDYKLSCFYNPCFNILSSITAVIFDILTLLVYKRQFETLAYKVTNCPDNLWIFKCDEQMECQPSNTTETNSTDTRWLCLEFNHDLLPGIFFILTLSGYFLMNLVVSVKGLKLVNTSKFSSVVQSVVLFFPGLYFLGVVAFYSVSQTEFGILSLVTCFASVPGPILLKLVDHFEETEEMETDEESSENTWSSLRAFLRIPKNNKKIEEKTTLKPATTSQKVELVIAEAYLFQASTVIPISMIFKIYFITSDHFESNFFQTATIVTMAVVNFFQIIHASRFYYKTRYIKFGEISKRNTLFNKNPTGTATELTFFQKYIFLPVDVILILVDHLFDILVILMYFKLSRKLDNSSEESEFATFLAITSIIIWVSSNVCLMWITNKRYQDLYQEDQESWEFGSIKFDPIKHKDGDKSSSVKSPSTKFKYIDRLDYI